MPRTSSMSPTQPRHQIGGLYVQIDGESQALPLTHTEVAAKIAGNLSRVEVTQTFTNPFTKPLEAVYVFPLPDQAAVDDMEIRIGDRTIKGNIKKREEAQQIYEQAKREGRTAGLLEQERDNVFTQSLANICPGEQIDVTIRYTDSLKFEAGNYEFVFPMVVGPRYIPGQAIAGTQDTDRVPDASRISPPVLPPATRSGHDIGVTVEINPGVPITSVESTSHKLKIEYTDTSVQVQLAGGDTIPNKDLILRYQVAGDNTQATVLQQADDRGGHFALYLIPAVDYRPDQIVAKDLVFLMDSSGSQAGDPIAKSKELMRRFINGLNPDDTFTIINFANSVSYLSRTPLTNTEANRTAALHYINQIQACGGTEMLGGIQAVMNVPAAPAGRIRSLVILTDGYIGNETEILAKVQRQLPAGNRFYSFGVGSSVNRFLLERLAEVGRGICRVVRQDEPTASVAEKFFQQINNPVLTNIQVTWVGNGDKPVIYPAHPPDLFAAQPLVLFGRKLDRQPGTLQITGTTAGGQVYRQQFNLTFDAAGNPAVAQLWGRSRIKELMNQMFQMETKDKVAAVTETALTYQLLSQYTAFVAVSDDVRVDPNAPSIAVSVPVEMPEGVSHQGIFGAGAVMGSVPRTAMRVSAPPGFGRSQPLPASASIADEFDDSDESNSYLMSPAAIGSSWSEEPAGFSDRGLEFEQVRKSHSQPIQIISAIGLDEAAIANLTQHLQSLQFNPGFSGLIVFEFTIKQGRVLNVVLDEQTSTLQDVDVIQAIKRSLLAWLVPRSLMGQVVLTLKVQS
ncbi:VIT domain-containing protein [Pantanalinema sp. GBBB05]|uniref:VIT domain-containing protein n=1 Tax=Pantanalinema sp. GBBB05 TaxID=2604139 RepID=UPI003D81B3D8